MDVKDLELQALDKHDVYVNNPDTEDFKCRKNGIEYVAKCSELSKFPKPIAEHIKKQLVKFLLNKRNLFPNSQTEERIYKEVSVDDI